ncbi:MAG TPA: DNA polymerase IV [Ornithinimicrobium sp.]|uniref:DNA polymerase IV n=1 Tax=Ornithinimicrobium sp. TaxID=1977084 RepID=UPI002B47D3DF|nr:DNA polymerase IV [Ornithinimicrobium sp.]HKJ12112.1 DNA polymerase IV [Ornithinimicrobium sp.]
MSGLDDGRQCTVLHVDMDAFYASVSLVDAPHLRGLPVIIGGGWRSVVLSATYPARAFGVCSGMPMAKARRLCPQATVLAPDHEQYTRVSEAVMAVFAEVTPLMQPVSMEEAFLDVSRAGRRIGSPARIAAWIKDTVADEQGIPCSVGGAQTKAVAKMASRAAKPDGVRMVPPHDVVSFLHPLPVGALWGVGEATETELRRFGLHTVADIAHLPVATLARIVGQAQAQRLSTLVWGGDTSEVVTPTPVERSVGSSQTFAHDVDDPVELHRHLLRLSERTTTRLRHASMMARTVVLTVRFSDFTTITRSRTMNRPTDVTRDVYATASRSYEALGLQRVRVRLLGVRVEGLSPRELTPVQARLDEPLRGWREAEHAVDRVASRFGTRTVQPASLLLVERRGDPPADLRSRPT